MDLAEQTEALNRTMALQGAHLGHHDEALHNIRDKLDQVATALSALIVRLDAAPTPAAQLPAPAQQAPPAAQPVPAAGAAALEPRIPPPAKYSGDPNTCRQFLTQCQLTFNAQPIRFASDAAKIAYLVNSLEGRPLSLYNALFEKHSPLAMSAEAFATELKRMFDYPIRGHQAGQQLMKIRQGRLTVREFVVNFRGLAVESGWNEAALITAFQNGLNRDIGKEIALRGEFRTLDEAVQLAIKTGDQPLLWRADSAGNPDYGRSEQLTSLGSRREMPYFPEPESMQIDGLHLSPGEKKRRLQTQSCLYCGRAGHFLVNCPVRPVKGPARQ